jgi:hypothetical protein
MDLTRDSTEYTGHPDGPAATHAAAALDTASALDTDRSAA